MKRKDALPGQNLELLNRHGLVRIPQIQQAMGSQALLRRGGLGGPHVHPPVHLAGVPVEDGEVKVAGHVQGQGRLAAGRGAKDHDEAWLLATHGETPILKYRRRVCEARW